MIIAPSKYLCSVLKRFVIPLANSPSVDIIFFCL